VGEGKVKEKKKRASRASGVSRQRLYNPEEHFHSRSFVHGRTKRCRDRGRKREKQEGAWGSGKKGRGGDCLSLLVSDTQNPVGLTVVRGLRENWVEGG